MAADPPDDGLDPDVSPDRSLDFESLLAAGVDGLASITGIQLVGVVTGLGILSTALWQSLFVDAIEWLLETAREDLDTTDPEIQRAIADLESIPETAGLTVDVSIPVILVGLVVLALASEAVMLVAARAFADGALDGIPLDLATRRLPLATLYGFFGGLLLIVAIGIGSLLLIVPGVIVYVGTLLFRQEVAIADKGPLQAISGSWALTKGNRWLLLAVAFVLFVLGYVLTIVVGYVPGTVGTVVSAAANATVAVFAVAVITAAYVRLREPVDARV